MAEDRHRCQVYDHRAYVGQERSAQILECTVGDLSDEGEATDIAVGWVADLRGASVEVLAVKKRYYASHRWANPEAYLAFAKEKRDKVKRHADGFVDALVKARLLTEEQQASISIEPRFEVWDGRDDKSVPLPKIADQPRQPWRRGTLRRFGWVRPAAPNSRQSRLPRDLPAASAATASAIQVGLCEFGYHRAGRTGDGVAQVSTKKDDEGQIRTPHLDLFAPLARRLDADDDPGLWDAVLGTVLGEIDARWEGEAPNIRRVHVGMFKVKRWLRPHQRRWIVDGPGFAAPDTYTSHPDQNAIWGVWLSRSSAEAGWVCTDTGEPGRRKRGEFVLRLSAPGNSARHQQAAVAGEWRPSTPWLGPAETEGGFVWYGFRRASEEWRLTGHQESKPRR